MKKLLMVLVCVSVLILLAGTVFAAADAKSATETKEITVKASVDVGENITAFLEKLAEKIGTTADKIFPWYVKQQILSGYLFLIIDGVSLLVGIFLLVCFYGKADWENSNLYTVLSVIGIVLCCLTLFFGVLGTSEAITQIYNPEYHALQTLVSDMAQLVVGK